MITNRHISSYQSKLDKTMTNEQFEQIVDAIVTGKYSWACVLILRFAGYNPLHYIPYRTYNRLIKDNCCSKRSQSKNLTENGERNQSKKLTTKIKDLSYGELLDFQERNIVNGGIRIEWNWQLPWQ
ncbi:HetP family heterocyst commitment protein [Pleurocapsales cyanobacterium LEGE 06147]|nr:HetP family heterocyst commitment protein [Pleurocapsales cyanobacterium LEGE 06147]